MTRLYTGPVPKQPVTSVAFTVIGNVPDSVGVPLNTPEEDKPNPLGSVLVVVNVVPALPPVCVKVSLKAKPTVPVELVGFVTTGLGLTVRDALFEITVPQRLLT